MTRHPRMEMKPEKTTVRGHILSVHAKKRGLVRTPLLPSVKVQHAWLELFITRALLDTTEGMKHA